MKIRELTEHWEQTAKGQLTERAYSVHLDIESAARLAALTEMYPKRTQGELLTELIRAALEELEASFPYVEGETVQATDELGDPIYQDIGPTPRFLELARKHLHHLQNQEGGAM